MRKDQIVAGAEVYVAEGEGKLWRVVPPQKATVVDPGPYRIVRQRQGAVYFVSWHRDPAGSAVLVQFDGEPKPEAVPARHLRGLWLETLAATGRTVAGVKAHDARIAELAASREPLSASDLMRLADRDEGVDSGTFGALARAIGNEGE